MKKRMFKELTQLFYLLMIFLLLVSVSGCDGEDSRRYIDGASPCGCYESDADGPGDETTDGPPESSDDAESEAAHSKELNYEAVFSDDVKRIDISIEPDTWQAMLDDMTEKFGEFGSAPDFFNGGGPGIPPGRDGGPPEGVDPDDFPFPGGSEGDFTPSSGAMPGFSDENPIWAECTISYRGITWNHVGVRFKGQSTLMSAWMGGVMKLPLRLDFDHYEEEHPKTEDQRFYGLKKLALSNNWSDNSMIREKVAGDIFRAAGVPMPRSTFCRVYVDHGEGAEYFGMYTLIEIPDNPFLKTQFDDDDGNLYKPKGGLTHSDELSGPTFAEGSFKEEFFEKETNKKKEDWSDIEAVFDALHSQDRIDDPKKWRENLEEVFNVEGFLRYLAVNTVIQNWDTYGNMAQNYFLYGEPKKKDRYFVHWIPWDNNMALMNFELMHNKPLSLDLSAEEVSEQWPLIRFLIDDPVYNSVYVSFVEETIAGAFDLEQTKLRFKKAHDLVVDYVVGENGEQTGYTFLPDPGAFEAEHALMIEFLEGRHEAAKTFLDKMDKD